MGRALVDATDFLILKEMFCGSESFRSDRVPVDAIARRLGLHRNTVSTRIRRLSEARIFLPASLDVEPGALGLVAALAYFEIPRERRTDALRDAVFGVEGVQTIFLLDRGWEVIAFARDEAHLFATLERLRALCDTAPPQLDILSSRDYPTALPFELTPLDARIMAALLRDSRASFNLVARETGVTAMTVKRRYDRLESAGVLFVYPSVTRPFDGMVVGFLLADVPDAAHEAATKAALLRALPDHFIRNLATRGRAHLLLFATGLQELDTMAQTARGIPGIAGVELRIMSGILMNPAHNRWLAGILEARAGRPAP